MHTAQSTVVYSNQPINKISSIPFYCTIESIINFSTCESKLTDQVFETFDKPGVFGFAVCALVQAARVNINNLHQRISETKLSNYRS